MSHVECEHRDVEHAVDVAPKVAILDAVTEPRPLTDDLGIVNTLVDVENGAPYHGRP